MKTVMGYTCEPLNKIIESHKQCSFPGVAVRLCNIAWKKYCHGNCSLFFPDGTNNVDRVLSKLLKKPVSKLTQHDKYEKKIEFEKQAFKRCRSVIIQINEGRDKCLNTSG